MWILWGYGRFQFEPNINFDHTAKLQKWYVSHQNVIFLNHFFVEKDAASDFTIVKTKLKHISKLIFLPLVQTTENPANEILRSHLKESKSNLMRRPSLFCNTNRLNKFKEI